MKTALKKKNKPSVRYEGLARQLREEIHTGALVAGQRLPSFIELQNRFSTTPNTINRALIELEREGLITRERWRGVFVAERKTERRHIIGLSYFNPTATYSPYWLHLMAGMREVVNRENYEITLLHPESTKGLEKVDGVIAHGDCGIQYLAKLPPAMPRVCVLMPMEDGSAVLADDFDGAHKAVKHLWELGHRRIGFFGHHYSPYTARRISGYQAAMTEMGGPDAQTWVKRIRLFKDEEASIADKRSAIIELGRINTAEWLADDWKQMGLTAVIAQNDEIAMGMMQAFQENGIRVPEDVSVIGYDSTELCEMCTPRLTSIRIPLERLGSVAVEMILNHIRHENNEPVTTILPVGLDVRGSTGLRQA